MNIKLHHDLSTATATQLELKADSEGRISGYGSIFGNTDRHGEVVQRGAFAKSLADLKQRGEMPVMLWSHMQEQPIGRWTSMAEDGKGLRVEGFLNLKTERGRDAYEHIKARDAGGLSIGYKASKDGRKYAGKGIFHLVEVELYEVSIVTVPANPAARIEGFKSLESKSEAIDMLRECGLSKKAAARFAAGGWSALADGYDEQKLKRLADSIDAATNIMRTRA